MKKQVEEAVTPLIYVGNKAGLLSEIATSLPTQDTVDRRWLVPFCGSLAPVLKFRPKRAIMSDLNSELMHFWKQIRDDPRAVLKAAHEHLPSADVEGDKTERERLLKPQYYKARNALNQLISAGTLGPERAGLFLIVNRFGWRGLWRVNQKLGHCNIPFYRPNGTLPAIKLLRSCQRYLELPGVELRCESWEDTLKEGVRDDDFAYIDPPYDGVTYTYSSTTERATVFGNLSQISLAATLCRMACDGVPFLAHNSPTTLVKNIYRASYIRWVVIHKDHKISYGKKLDPSAVEVILTATGRST